MEGRGDLEFGRGRALAGAVGESASRDVADGGRATDNEPRCDFVHEFAGWTVIERRPDSDAGAVPSGRPVATRQASAVTKWPKSYVATISSRVCPLLRGEGGTADSVGYAVG